MDPVELPAYPKYSQSAGGGNADKVKNLLRVGSCSKWFSIENFSLVAWSLCSPVLSLLHPETLLSKLDITDKHNNSPEDYKKGVRSISLV